MGKHWQWYLDKTWRNIWWWRIVAITAWVIMILIVWTFFDMLDDYDKMYRVLKMLGHLS